MSISRQLSPTVGSAFTTYMKMDKEIDDYLKISKSSFYLQLHVSIANVHKNHGTKRNLTTNYNRRLEFLATVF